MNKHPDRQTDRGPLKVRFSLFLLAENVIVDISAYGNALNFRESKSFIYASHHPF